MLFFNSKTSLIRTSSKKQNSEKDVIFSSFLKRYRKYEVAGYDNLTLERKKVAARIIKYLENELEQ